MMTSSNGNIFRVTGHLCGEFTGPGDFPAQRPVTRRFDVFFDLRLNKRLSKQWWGWWFETLSRPLWRHRNVWFYCCCYLSKTKWLPREVTAMSGSKGTHSTYTSSFLWFAVVSALLTFCEENPSVTDGCLSQRGSSAVAFPCHDIIMCYRNSVAEHICVFCQFLTI